MIRQCRQISHKIQAEDSVQRAIEAFHKHLPSKNAAITSKQVIS